MRIILFFFMLGFLSCRNDIIKYRYDDVVVTRVDRDGEAKLYYGDFDNNFPDSCIKIEYSGFNSGISGYLVFHPDKRVQVISEGGGYYTSSYGENSMLFLKNYEDSKRDLSNDSIKGRFDRVLYLSGIGLEREINTKNNSNVKAIYPK